MSTEIQVIDFETLAWDEQQPGIQLKTLPARDGSVWNRVTYAPGARRDDVWCEKGHHGFVLEGTMSYEYQNGETFSIPAGRGFLVAAGRAHRGHNISEAPATLLMIDDAAEPNG